MPTEWHLLEILARDPGKLITQRHLLTARQAGTAAPPETADRP